MDKVAVHTCVSSMSKFQIALQERDKFVREATTAMCEIKTRQTILSEDLRGVQKSLRNHEKRLEKIWETLERIGKEVKDTGEQYER